MPNCTGEQMMFGRVGRREIEADFSGGAIGSGGGVMLVRQEDRRIGLSAAVAKALADPRNPARFRHPLRDLVALRLYGLCCGYQDLNDHDRLRHDPLLQTAVGKVGALASGPTFSRLEMRATRADVMALNRVLLEQFIASHREAPGELVLDADASAVPLHGDQEMSQFHGYYDHYCYLPLYIFCEQASIACTLRPSRIDVARLRQAWPLTQIVVRGDSGFCRQRLIRWCERNGVGYVIGVARNAHLHRHVAAWERELEAAYQREGTKQRFVVTNLDLPADALYDELYCQRGEAENRIKEARLDLFGTRASCHKFLANWLRLMFATLAYTLMQRLRDIALQGTELVHATATRSARSS